MKSTANQARRAAAQAEAQRRWSEAEVKSPLSRADFQALLDAVAERIAQCGHTNSFAYTDVWLAEHAIAPSPVHDFLNTHNVFDDYAFIIQGDPYTLFGPAAGRLRWMPLEREDLEDLIGFVDDRVQENGCDHTHRFTRQFLSSRGLPHGTAEMAFLAQGGGCDCEVVLNVDADAIFSSGP